MNYSLKIKQLGQLDDVFGFYQYLTQNLDCKNSILLESVAEDTHSMLFSFIGINPDFLLKVMGDKLSIFDIQSEFGENIKEVCDKGDASVPIQNAGQLPFEDNVPLEIPALDALRKCFATQPTTIPNLFPRRIFTGGLCGYIGYDVIAPFVGYNPSEDSQMQYPNLLMGLFTTVLAFDHSSKAIYQIENTQNNQAVCKNTVEQLYEQFKQAPHSLESIPKYNKNQLDSLDLFQSNTTPSQWEKMISDAKENIMAGDIIQAVLSRKITSDLEIPPINVYRALREINPSPYMYYLNFENAHNGSIRLIGSSPEALVSKDQTHLETVPIAGTRRRGKNAKEEAKIVSELLNDEKENAEHIMLVDLARNDFARISIPGTVDTYELKQLRKYPHIMHLISKVRSETNLDSISILKAVFPAGTVSGAPKKRAMEIIHNLEQEDRGPYAGCVGYLSFNGDMDMAIAIRTIFNKNNQYAIQAGAGIVADSTPEFEYHETENKMQGVLRAVNAADLMEI